jgi:hypothetical protein
VLNDNHDFRDITTHNHNGTNYQVPTGMGLHAGGDFFDKFETQMYQVKNESDPQSRPAVVRDLLAAMGRGNASYMARHFNILRVKRKPGSPAPTSWTFYIPRQQFWPGNSFVCWMKTNAPWNWNGDTDGQWKQRRFVKPPTSGGQDALGYQHVDFIAPSDADAEIYLALPSIVPGTWPEDRKLGALRPSVETLIRRAAA